MVLTLTTIIKLILDPRVSKGGRSETGGTVFEQSRLHKYERDSLGREEASHH